MARNTHLFILLPLCLVFAFVNAQGPISYEKYNIRLDNNYSEYFDLGKINVPENRQLKTSKTIEINFVYLRSRASTAETPVFYLAGGPGFSGINSIKSEKLGLILLLQQTRDVILIDQRGTGISQPLLTSTDKMDLPLDKPLEDRESINRYLAHVKEMVKVAKEKNIDLNAYNSKESAADIDDIRKSLGYSKIIIWGHSYGSHLGLVYIKTFEKHVEKAILQGVNGLNQRYRFPTEINLVLNKIDTLIQQNIFLKKELPAFSSLLKEELEKLEKHPVTIAVFVDNKKIDVTFGRMDMEAFIIVNIGNTGFIRELPELIFQMRKGNYSRAGELAYKIKTIPKGTIMSFTMHYSSGCTSERLNAIRLDISQGILGNAINYPYAFEGLRELIPVNDLGDDFRKDPVSSIPVLFASGTFDGRTSLKDALEVKQGFRNSVHAIFENSSHDFLSPAFAPIVVSFLSGQLKKDTVVENAHFDLYALNSIDIFMKMSSIISSEGVGGLKKYFNPAEIYLSSTSVLPVAYRYLANKKTQIAIDLLKLNQEVFSTENWQIINVLGDAYFAHGDTVNAIQSYKKSVILNPMNYNGIVKLKQIEGFK